MAARPPTPKRAPRPATPAELAYYGGILPNYLPAEGFEFDGPKGKTLIRLAPLIRSDDTTFSYHAVRSGAGIGFLPSWLVDEDLRRGTLLRVLPQYTQAPQELYATYISRQYLTPKVRSFIDFMAAHFRKMDYERKWTGRF